MSTEALAQQGPKVGMPVGLRECDNTEQSVAYTVCGNTNGVMDDFGQSLGRKTECEL